MKKSYKAAWISGLVFPGAGYFSLNKPKHAAIVILLSAGCLYGLIEVSMARYHTLMDLIVNGKVAPDVISVMNALQTISLQTAGWQDYLGYGFLLCWGVSIFDAIRLAKEI